MLRLVNGETFATGVCPYRDQHPKDPPGNARIVITVEIGGCSIQAALDTGGAFFILDPDLAQSMACELEMIGPYQINMRGNNLRGLLSRCRITLRATAGRSHQAEVTVFVPNWDGARPWQFPSILGLSGGLEAFRFAVDPRTNQFYFGPLPD